MIPDRSQATRRVFVKEGSYRVVVVVVVVVVVSFNQFIVCV